MKPSTIRKNPAARMAALCLIGAGAVGAQSAMTPPMGWNSWNNFGCGETAPISETLLKSTADKIVESGMKDAGYNYVNVDDCWHGVRDPNGTIHASGLFTGGSMDSLSAYIHSKGLKFGIYTCAGTRTCAKKPGSQGYEAMDIAQYVKWGVDYVKVDWCEVSAAQQNDPVGTYKKFSDAIKANHSNMVLSICNWGEHNPWQWGKAAGGQLWRTTHDIALGWDSFTHIVDLQLTLGQFSGPGYWNDPDMLEVGRGMTVDEDKSHFGMWCMMAAPLIAGNDVRLMNATTKEILTNNEAIAVDQDALGIAAQRATALGNPLEVWVRPLAGGARAVGLFNRSTAAATITVNWADLNQASKDPRWSKYMWDVNAKATVHDLWAHKDLATGQATSFGVSVPSHGLALLKIVNPAAGAVLPFAKLRPGVDLQPGMIKITLPGEYHLKVLDMSGRTLWSRSGNGASDYAIGNLGAQGARVLQVATPESNTSLEY